MKYFAIQSLPRRSTTGICLLGLLLVTSCSPKRFLVDQIGRSMGSAGSVYLTENDPQLVKDAFPFNLKTLEVLLQQSPENPNLLLAATTGFAMYGYAFVLEDAERTIQKNFSEGTELYKRALILFNRARNYGERALVASYPQVEWSWTAIRDIPTEFSVKDIPLFYWNGVALAGAISASQGAPEYVVELPKVGWFFETSLALDPAWNHGSLYSAMIKYSMIRPDAGPDKEQVARTYFQKAIQASQGNDCSPYLALAEAVTVQNQNREEFVHLLNLALAIDVDAELEFRLANILAQSRARWLLGRIDELFY